MKKIKQLITIWLCFMALSPCIIAQTKSQQLSVFKEQLAGISGSFTNPEGFKEIIPPSSSRLPFQYGLKLSDGDFEIWFQVNSTRADWQHYELTKQTINPDSLYVNYAKEEAIAMCGSNDYISRLMPPFILERYNADEGRSYFFTLTDMPATNHYQYALLIVLQKNHYGNLIAVCLGNERGPAFYQNVNKLKSCFRFINEEH